MLLFGVMRKRRSAPHGALQFMGCTLNAPFGGHTVKSVVGRFAYFCVEVAGRSVFTRACGFEIRDTADWQFAARILNEAGTS